MTVWASNIAFIESGMELRIYANRQRMEENNNTSRPTTYNNNKEMQKEILFS